MDHNQDLSKRWFIQFSFRNPTTGKMDRFKKYEGINRYKTLKERKAAAKEIKEFWTRLLQEGFNPFETFSDPEAPQEPTLLEGFNYMYKIKEQNLANSTWKSAKSKFNSFKNWFSENGMDGVKLADVRSADILTYLNQLKVGKNTRNDYLAHLRAGFQICVDHEMIPVNPCATIELPEGQARKNTPFTTQEVKQILEYLKPRDPQLYLIVKLVGYCWLRPVEVARLRIRDIDFDNRTITVDTKKKIGKVKRLIDAVYPDLKKACADQPKGYHLVGVRGKPAVWDTSDVDKRNCIGRWFRKKVKEPFDFGHEYGIYSFRHTFSRELYNKLIESGMTKGQAMWRMLPITGHQSVKALSAYLRDIGAELPEDYSDLLKDI